MHRTALLISAAALATTTAVAVPAQAATDYPSTWHEKHSKHLKVWGSRATYDLHAKIGYRNARHGDLVLEDVSMWATGDSPLKHKRAFYDVTIGADAYDGSGKNIAAADKNETAHWDPEIRTNVEPMVVHIWATLNRDSSPDVRVFFSFVVCRDGHRTC